MRRLFAVLFLLMPLPLAAQTSPCRTPGMDLALNPARIWVEAEIFAKPMIEGTTIPQFDEVVLGHFLPGVNPAVGGAPITEEILARTAFTPEPSGKFPHCFVADLGLGGTPIAARYSAVKFRRVTPDKAEGAWSELSNPFAQPGALPPPSAVRRTR
jgi:hypothetical protein